MVQFRVNKNLQQTNLLPKSLENCWANAGGGDWSWMSDKLLLYQF